MAFPVTALRGWALGILVVYWSVCLLATHWPDSPGGIDDGISDKTLHYVGYAGLGFFLLGSLTFRRPWRASFVPGCWIVASLYGIFDEYTQQFFGRETDMHDWYADVVGALSGTLLFSVLWMVAQKWGRIVFIYPDPSRDAPSSRIHVAAAPTPLEETLEQS